MNYKVTKVLPVTVQVEISLDDQDANIFFKTKDGETFILQYYDEVKATYMNLAIKKI